MTRKDDSFSDQNLQSVAVKKKVKNFHLHFFNFNSSFSDKIFNCNVPVNHNFPAIPDLLNSFKYSKSYKNSKN